MRAYELKDLIEKAMAVKGYGSKEIVCNGGFQKITGIEWCEPCDQFEIISEPTLHANELLRSDHGNSEGNSF